MAGLTRAEKENITSLAAFARKKANIITAEKAFDIVAGRKPPTGDNPEHRRTIKIAKKEYRVVFSLDEVVTGGLVRHASISVEQKRPQNLIAVNMITKLLGFETTLTSLDDGEDSYPRIVVYTEVSGKGDAEHHSVNIIEEVRGADV